MEMKYLWEVLLLSHTDSSRSYPYNLFIALLLVVHTFQYHGLLKDWRIRVIISFTFLFLNYYYLLVTKIHSIAHKKYSDIDFVFSMHQFSCL